MWVYSIDIQGIVIMVIAILLNIVLVKKLMETFAVRRLWLAGMLCGVETACYLIPYFAGGRNFYVQEMAGGTLLFLACFFLIQKKGAQDEGAEKPDKKRIALLLVIPVTGMVALISLLLGDLKPYGFAVLCGICILAADLSVFYLADALIQNDTHVRQRDTYRQQTDHYRNQLEVIEESQSRLRALRHDMKNHMLHLEAELQQGHYEDALRYLEKMEGELENPAEHAKTGNRDIDSLLNYKIQKAEQVLSAVESDIHVPMELMPKSFDINVILGNLLDNAIEAAQGSRRKWMKLVLRADRGVFLIHIANSCASPPKRKAGRFLSTKENAVEHGIGLQNVKRMVEKQNGNIEFQYEDGIFLVEVMLYMNEM